MIIFSTLLASVIFPTKELNFSVILLVIGKDPPNVYDKFLPVFIYNFCVYFMVNYFDAIGNHIRVFPDFMKRAFRCSYQPMETIIKTIPFSILSCALASRLVIYLYYLCIKSILLTINTGRKPRNPSTNYNYFFIHGSSLFVFC